ncbi:MAG TPA: glucokinase [Anaeromyxobacteraceae bacterium]|nr:glucokinase [Anaeromyxobacteraceae bacterium]
MILACDVGGTKTSLALFETEGSQLRVVRLQTYASREYASLYSMLEGFVGGAQLKAAGFGVAGPVVEGCVRTTNLPWVVDSLQLARLLGLGSVALVNDLEAHAWAVGKLVLTDVVELQAGKHGAGNVAVIGAGTGLGVSALVRGGTRTAVSLASEGGHADFAPVEDVEIELMRHLRSRFDHVSVERVISGPGLVEIYRFLRDAGRHEEPAWLVEQMELGDPSAVIASTAMAGRFEPCLQATMLFIALYGAEAGNWALRTLATGGVYLGGGIARKLIAGPGLSAAWSSRATDAFLSRFRAKGRFRPMMEAIPVRVIVNEQAALVGAAEVATRMALRDP